MFNKSLLSSMLYKSVNSNECEMSEEQRTQKWGAKRERCERMNSQLKSTKGCTFEVTQAWEEFRKLREKKDLHWNASTARRVAVKRGVQTFS